MEFRVKMADRSRLRVESISEANVTKTSAQSVERATNNGSRGSYDGYSNKVNTIQLRSLFSKIVRQYKRLKGL